MSTLMQKEEIKMKKITKFLIKSYFQNLNPFELIKVNSKSTKLQIFTI